MLRPSPRRGRRLPAFAAPVALCVFLGGTALELFLHRVPDDRHHGVSCAHDDAQKGAAASTAAAALGWAEESAAGGDEECAPCTLRSCDPGATPPGLAPTLTVAVAVEHLPAWPPAAQRWPPHLVRGPPRV